LAPRQPLLREYPLIIGRIQEVHDDNLISDAGILEFKIEGDQISPGSVSDSSLFFHIYICKKYQLNNFIQWCSNCRNGGEMVVCTICGINSICTDCIEFDETKLEGINFECPSCFIRYKAGEKYVRGFN
jgi:hypothetical protein